MARLAAFALVLALFAGCSTTSRSLTDEISAQLPRAQGLGTFQPSCLFLCFSRAQFDQRDQLSEELDELAGQVNTQSTRTLRKKGHAP